MFDLLSVLYAVADTDTWDHGELVSWADKMIGESRCPADWIVDVSLSKSSDEVIQIVFRASLEFDRPWPSDLAKLEVGLVLVRLQLGLVDVEKADLEVTDIVDGGDAGVLDPELVLTLDLANLESTNGSAYKELRANRLHAKEILDHLTSEDLFSLERELLERN